MIKRISIILGISTLLIICLVYFWPFHTESLSAEAAGQRAQKLYGGTIEDTTKADGYYVVRLHKKGQVYEVKVDDAEGAILNMNALEEGTQSDQSNEQKEPSNEKVQQEDDQQASEKQLPAKNAEDENDGLITAIQASDIVLERIDGSMKKSGIESQLNEDDDHYIYEVEIELADGSEVEAEVDAFSGKVLYFYAEEGHEQN